MTIRLYADRKGWPLGTVTVELSHGHTHARDCKKCEEADDVMLDIIHKRVVGGDLDVESLSDSMRSPVGARFSARWRVGPRSCLSWKLPSPVCR